MGKKVFDEKTSLWKNFLSLIIFMRNEIRRAIYSTDYIKSISIYFLSSSIGFTRQIYIHIRIEEFKWFRHLCILRLQIRLKVLENNKKYEKSEDTRLFKIFQKKSNNLDICAKYGLKIQKRRHSCFHCIRMRYKFLRFFWI